MAENRRAAEADDAKQGGRRKVKRPAHGKLIAKVAEIVKTEYDAKGQPQETTGWPGGLSVSPDKAEKRADRRRQRRQKSDAGKTARPWWSSASRRLGDGETASYQK